MPWGHPADTGLRVPRCGRAPWGTGRRRSGCAAGTGGRWPSPTPWGGCRWPWHVLAATWPWSPASRSCRCHPCPRAVTCPACASPPRCLPAPTQVWPWPLVPSPSSVTVSCCHCVLSWAPGHHHPAVATVTVPSLPCHCHHVPFLSLSVSPPAFPLCDPHAPTAASCTQVSPPCSSCRPVLCSLCIPMSPLFSVLPSFLCVPTTSPCPLAVPCTFPLPLGACLIPPARPPCPQG